LFHKSNVFGSCIIHILYTGCAKIKKNNSGARSLKRHRNDNIPGFVARNSSVRRCSRGEFSVVLVHIIIMIIIVIIIIYCNWVVARWQ